MVNYPMGVTDSDPHFNLGEDDDLTYTPDICHLCGTPESHRMPVRQCQVCDEYTCQNCVEFDYEEVGDPPVTVCCQWLCLVCLEKEVKQTVRLLQAFIEKKERLQLT